MNMKCWFTRLKNLACILAFLGFIALPSSGGLLISS
jgi:hypothetical protein